MKNFVLFLVVLALIGSATAQYAPGTWGFAANPAPTASGLPENPYTFSLDGNLTDLDLPPNPATTPDIWGTWGGDSGGTGLATVASGVLTITTNSYELAFSHDQAVADLPGSPVAGTDDVMIVIDVKSVTGPGFVSCKIEYYDSTDAFPNDDNGAGSIRIDDFDVAGNGETQLQFSAPGVYTFSSTDSNKGPIPATCVAISPVIAVAGGTAAEATVVEFNSIYIGKAVVPYASDPIPENQSVKATGSVSDLSWSLPELEADSTLGSSANLGVEVKFESSGLVLDPDPNFPDDITLSGTGITTTAIADMTDGTGTPPAGALADGFYYWQVIVTDANSAGSVVKPGPVWTFEVGDAPATVTPPADDYMWVSQSDTDGDPTIRTFTVTIPYTDDGKSPITAVDVNNLNWGWDPGNVDEAQFGLREVGTPVWTPGPGTHTSGSVSQTYETVAVGGDLSFPTDETTIPGFWNIRLEVTDGTGTALGTATHYEILDTCADAATADPADTFDAKYDSDQNCKNDLVDLAAFLAVWLDQSAIYE